MSTSSTRDEELGVVKKLAKNNMNNVHIKNEMITMENI
jgi:hypothetical protein